jgi:hypothetical protein
LKTILSHFRPLLPLRPSSPKSVLLLSFRLLFGFLRGFTAKILYAFLTSRILITIPHRHNFIDFSVLKTLGELYEFFSYVI